MNFRASEARPRVLNLDFTSMVDLVFLLIIFFLTTSTFIEKNRAPLELPKDHAEAQFRRRADRPATLVVNLTRNGTIIVAGEYVALDALVEKVRQERDAAGGAAELDLVLRADRNAPLRFVNEVAERLVDLGLRQWRLASELTGARPEWATERGGAAP